VIDRIEVHRRAAEIGPRAIAEAIGLELGKRSRERYVVAHCCFHSPDRNASLRLTVRNGVIVGYCHACSQGGDWLRLLAEQRGMSVSRDFGEVLKAGADIVGVSDSGGTRKWTKPRRRHPITTLAAAIDEQAHNWLNGGDFTHEPLIDEASPEDLREALAVLSAAVDARRDAERARDTELERLADEYEASPRNTWKT
jgi:hypothetical protein